MKKYFLTGLIILMPVALTIMIISFLFNFFTTPFLHIVESLLDSISARAQLALPPDLDIFISRILALILLCAFILLLGIIARWFIIKNLLSGTHRLLSRIPFIKTVYKVCRDVFAALFSAEGKKAFKYPVMFPFPHRPSYAIGFRAGEVAEEVQQKIQTPLVSVFAPTAPHPISGFLFLVPEKDVHTLDMSNEEAVKYLVSCGLVRPDADLFEARDAIP